MMEFIYPHTHLVAGVDEVGRGPLVGAVVTATVILDPAWSSGSATPETARSGTATTSAEAPGARSVAGAWPADPTV